MSKAKRGSGFRGVCEYAITRSGKKERGEIIGGNMSGISPRELAAEFGQVRNLRADIEKPVSHNCLRLPLGERLSPEMWMEVADDFMSQMGFTDKNQRVYVLHDDKDGQHIHLIANRIREDGKIWLGKNENLLATKIINSLELKYKLRVTVEKAEVKEKKEPKKQESERAKRKNEEPPRTKIQKAIDKIFAESKAPLEIGDLHREMKKADIWIKINRASTGKINGFAFDYQGVRFKGSDLGKAYSLSGLEKRGLIIPKTYKQEQEQHAKLHKIYESNTERYEEGRPRVNISDTPDLRSLSLGYVVHDSKRRAEMLLHADKNNSMGRSGYGRDYGMRRTDSGIGGARELKIIKNDTKKDNNVNTQNYIYNDSEISEFERKRLEAIRLDGWYHYAAYDKIVYKKDGQQIEDRGSKIIVDGNDYQKLAVASVELALLKGWKLEDIKAGGEKEFVKAIAKEIAKRQNQNATQNIIENVIENDTKKDTQNDDDNDEVKHNEKSWDEVVEQIIADNYDGKSLEEALEEVEAMEREPDRDRGLDV